MAPRPGTERPGPRAAGEDVVKAQAARDALAAEHIPFVRSIAAKVKRSVAKQIDLDDLVEYGMIGLLEAAQRYDPGLGAQFTTFAYYRIRGAIYDGLRGMGWLKRGAYAKARFEERSNELMATWPQAPQRPGSSYQQAVATLADAVGGMAMVYITSLDAAASANLADGQQIPADQALGLEQSRARVRGGLAKLAPQERKLLELYYYQDLNLQQVGQVLGLSKSWTSRLHARAIDKLQRVLGQMP